MFTSDTDQKLHRCARTALVYILISLFCGLFGGVYEHFSHGVYSYHMIYAFAYPLGLGAFSFLAMGLFGKTPTPMTAALVHCAIATLTVGSILRGVLDIYGTTNFLTAVYPWAGWILTAISGILWVKNAFFTSKPSVDIEP